MIHVKEVNWMPYHGMWRPQLGIGCQVRGHFFFFFFFKLITFTLAYFNNVKHLTCIILCSSGLQNINTSSRNGSV